MPCSKRATARDRFGLRNFFQQIVQYGFDFRAFFLRLPQYGDGSGNVPGLRQRQPAQLEVVGGELIRHVPNQFRIGIKQTIEHLPEKRFRTAPGIVFRLGPFERPERDE